MTTGAVIQTVLGPVPAGDLGATLVLEHLHADFTDAETDAGASDIADAPLDFAILGEVALGAVNRENLTLTDGALTAAELRHFADAGGHAVIDATPADLGRDPGALRRLARDAGLHLVMGSGLYRPGRDAADPEEVAAGIVADLTRGVVTPESEAGDGPPVRAGVIGRLAALDPGDPSERDLLTAAGLAQAATGAPLYLESGPLPQTLAAIERVRESSGGRGTLALAGCGALAPRPAEVVALAETGAFVLFDRIGRLGNVHRAWDDAHVIDAIRALLEAGCGDRILLSPGIRERIDLVAYGGTGYGLLQGPYLPLLQAAGLGAAGLGGDFLQQVLVANPARFLAGEGVRHDAA